jgi:hypothetical protein
MVPTTAAGADREQEESWLQVELDSLGIDCKRKNELNDKEELEALATARRKSIFENTRLLMMMMISTKKLTNHTLAISFR